MSLVNAHNLVIDGYVHRHTTMTVCTDNLAEDLPSTKLRRNAEEYKVNMSETKAESNILVEHS